MKTILFTILSFACFGQMCPQWKHLEQRSDIRYAMNCPKQLIETDSTVIRITPNCNEIDVKCDICGTVIKYGDPETIETFIKPIKGVPLSDKEKDNLCEIFRNGTGTVSIDGISDTLFFKTKWDDTGKVTYPAVPLTDTLIIDYYDTSKVIFPKYILSGYIRPDTVKVIILVSDIAEEDQFYFITYPVAWMRGYLATDKKGNATLLDANKKQIPENIIIWDYKPIE